MLSQTVLYTIPHSEQKWVDLDAYYSPPTPPLLPVKADTDVYNFNEWMKQELSLQGRKKKITDFRKVFCKPAASVTKQDSTSVCLCPTPTPWTVFFHFQTNEVQLYNFCLFDEHQWNNNSKLPLEKYINL